VHDAPVDVLHRIEQRRQDTELQLTRLRQHLARLLEEFERLFEKEERLLRLMAPQRELAS
jgi:replication fork clamp-binding protein CrfC